MERRMAVVIVRSDAAPRSVGVTAGLCGGVGAGNPVASVVPIVPVVPVAPGTASVPGGIRSAPVVGAGLGVVVVVVVGSGVAAGISDIVVVVVVVVGACAGRSSPPHAATPSVHINTMHDFFISSSVAAALFATRAPGTPG